MRLTTLKSKNSAAYKGLMAQLLQCGARDFYQGDEIERSRYFDDSVDMHHVFPKAWCKAQNIDRERYDSVLNKTPLTGRSNRRVGSKAPSGYLKAIENGGMNDLDLVLRSHLIEPAALRSDDFVTTWRTRARELLDRVESATGKPVQGRDSAEVVGYFRGDVLPLAKPTASINAVARLFEKYEILETLPSGGMSEGFKVRGEAGVVLFLKRVPVTGIPADALHRELDIYARLERAQARHVLQVHAFERSDDAVALLTEFADGGALSDVLRRSPGGLSPQVAKPIALEILAGLSELHSLDIVHRDLKPENVFHTGAAPHTTWKLGDFGISKSLVRLQTQGRTFQGHGTPGFAPPEQMEGAEAHASADIYSFGKIIAYLLTGQTDVDQIRWPSWAKIARDCTSRAADQRPGLDEVEMGVGGLVV